MARSHIQPLFGASLLVLLFLMTVTVLSFDLMTSYLELDTSSEAAVEQALVQIMQPLQLALLIIAAPFEAGLVYLAWRKVRGLDAPVKQVFSPWAMATPLIAIALISSVLAQLGLTLFIVPGLYLLAVLSLANLYYLFRRGSPIKAMWECAKVCHRQVVTIGLYHLIMAAILAISAIPLGLGLIFTVPMFFYGKALLYIELFPQEQQSDDSTPPQQPTNSSSSSHFEA
ncbi:hypothetical protein [Ferrimonas senticii]|uniref:hypothetical protein n=1 Tax=Ferrimonas senticii TaxID=394566 RepID=UPI0012EBA861|nr:hypothetical protein [Ferrimonas senticii]